MASEIRVNQIQNRSGLGTVTFSDTGVVISGITTISDLRTSGTTVVAAGTTSAPSISPSGDSNTGIFFPSPDTVAIAEGGVEILRVDSSGNVGINTTNPPDKLTVLGKVQVQQDSGSNNRIVLRGQPSSSYRWNLDNYSSSNTFRIFREDDATSASGAVAMSIDASTRNVTISGGNLIFDSGKGIDFSATANSSGTMTSELLSDYEEGTFTPELYFDNSEIGTKVTNYPIARYVRIGMVVHVNGVIGYNSINTSNSTYLRMRGLPFNVYEYGQPNNWTQPGIIRVNGNAPSEFAIAAGNSATNRAICIYNNAGATDQYVTNSNVTGWNGNSRYFWFSLTYYTNS